MKKLLFVHTNSLSDVSGGADVTRKAFSVFSEKYEVITYFSYENTNKIKIFINAFFNYLKSSFLDFLRIKRIIKDNKIKYVYIDDSVNGKLIKLLRKSFPSLYIVVNFHNDEVKYYRDMFKNKGVLYYGLYRSSLINQKYSVNYSDYRLYITEDDKNSINSNDFSYSIVPATLRDNFVASELTKDEGKYFLFFGSAFFANIEAAEIIIKYIAPNVFSDFIIAGKNMDKAFADRILPRNVKVLGFIENLNALFDNAKAFVCPIFSGSGMKVKLVEALMFGKHIICSDFAAIGYDKKNNIFKIANTPEDYVEQLNNFNSSKFNIEARQLYLDKYCSACNKNYYTKLFENMESVK